MVDESNKLVRIRVKSEVLRRSYGQIMHVGMKKAMQAERDGWGEIIRDEPEYQTKPVDTTRSGVVPFSTKDLPFSAKKKLVAWVHDTDSGDGGAELSSEEVVRVGRNCGFQVVKVTPGCWDRGVILGAGMVVLNSLIGLDQAQMADVFAAIRSRGIPYIKYEHDHRELQQRPDWARKIYSGSALNVFISPMHMRNYAPIAEGICLPLAIDVDKFNPDPSVSRRPGTALVCNVRSIRRWTDLQGYVNDHPEVEFHVLHDGAQGEVTGPNVKAARSVPHASMPSTYSRYDMLVHMMSEPGAGERVIFEAALCGCKVVANSQVGHMSWFPDGKLPENGALRAWLREGPYEFWRIVHRVMGG